METSASSPQIPALFSGQAGRLKASCRLTVTDARPVPTHLVDPYCQRDGVDRGHLFGLGLCRGDATILLAGFGLGHVTCTARGHVCVDLAFF